MNKVGVYSSPPCIPVLSFFDKLHFDHADDDDADIEMIINGDVAYLCYFLFSSIQLHFIDIENYSADEMIENIEDDDDDVSTMRKGDPLAKYEAVLKEQLTVHT